MLEDLTRDKITQNKLSQRTMTINDIINYKFKTNLSVLQNDEAKPVKIKSIKCILCGKVIGSSLDVIETGFHGGNICDECNNSIEKQVNTAEGKKRNEEPWWFKL